MKKTFILAGLILTSGFSSEVFSQQGTVPTRRPPLQVKRIINTDAKHVQSRDNYDDKGDYYLFQGKKIPLLRSRSEFSVSFKNKKAAVGGILAGKKHPVGHAYSSRKIDANNEIVEKPVSAPGDSAALESMKTAVAEDTSVACVNNVYMEKSGGRPFVLTDKIIVKFSDTTKVKQLAARYDCIISGRLGGNKFALSRRAGKNCNLLNIADSLTMESGVEWAEPEFISVPEKMSTPNDPLFGRQWHLLNNGGGISPAGIDIGATHAWDLGPFDTSMVLAIIDDGVDSTQPDLKIAPGGKCYAGSSITNDFQPGYDQENHGTSCAGVACALSNNNIGVSGICPRSSILPIKISKKDTGITSTRLAEAITYASQHADVISMSFGFPKSSDIENAIKEASVNGRSGKGVPVFCSSGNSHTKFFEYSMSLSETCSVAFVFKNRSDTDPGNDYIALDNVRAVSADGSTVTFFEPFAGTTLPAGWKTYGGDLDHFPDTVSTASRWSDTDQVYSSGFGDNHSVYSGVIAEGKWSELRMPMHTFQEDEKLNFSLNISCSPDDSFYIKIYYNDGGIGLAPITLREPEPFDPNIAFPASSDSAIAVGASNDYDFRSDYSQFNDVDDKKSVDFLAPSGGGFKNITTTDRVGADGYNPDGDYNSTFSGTSSACPLAAGVAMLVLAQNPDLSRDKVLEAMRRGCKKIGGVTYDANGFNKEYGYGRIDAYETLRNISPVITGQKATIYMVRGYATDIDPSMLTIKDNRTPDGPFTVNVLPGSGYLLSGSQVTYQSSDDSIRVSLTVSNGTYTSDPFTVTVKPKEANHPPSFTKGANITVNEDQAGIVKYGNWAKNFSYGSDPTAQSLSISVVADHPELFTSSKPAIDLSTGDLSFTLKLDAYGISNLRIVLKDNGGSEYGGVDTFVTTSTITVNPVNDRPSFVKEGDVTVDEDDGNVIVNGWASGMTCGQNESQTLQFHVYPTNPSLFSVLPHIDSLTGDLSFTTAPNVHGTTSARVVLKDNGGVAFGGCDSFGVDMWITVSSVNDPPEIKVTGGVSVYEADSLTLDIETSDADGDTVLLSIGSLPSIAVPDSLTPTHFRIHVKPDWGDTGKYQIFVSSYDKNVMVGDTISIVSAAKKRAVVTVAGIDDSTVVMMGGAGGWSGIVARKGNGRIDGITPGNYLFTFKCPSKRATSIYLNLRPGTDTSVTVHLSDPVAIAFDGPDTLKSNSTPFVVSNLRSCAYEDLNGDGKNDLITLQDAGKVSIYSDVSGSFNLVGQFDLNADVRCVGVIDYDLDGDNDLVFGFYNGRVSLRKNRGGMALVDTLIDLFKADDMCTGFTPARLNDDDSPDFLLSFQNGNVKAALSGTGGYTVSAVDSIDDRAAVSRMNQAILTMDITGDGDQEMIAAQVDSSLTWYLREGGLSFGFKGVMNLGGNKFNASMPSIAPCFSRPDGIPGFLTTTYDGYVIRFAGRVKGDFNGDGKVDISDLQLMGLKWSLKDGDGNWSPLINLNLAPDAFGKQSIDIMDLQVLGNCWGAQW